MVRTLGLTAACAIAIANMIGQGVFLKARAMECNAGSPALMLAAWVVAGVLALCGALTLAELGAAIPATGGIYAFLQRAYGGGVAFAYGWMSVFVGIPASIAALGAGAAIFFNGLTNRELDALGIAFAAGPWHIAVSGVQFAAIALIAVMTAINCLPAVVNGRIVTVFAIVKVAMVAAVAAIGFAFAHAHAPLPALTSSGARCAGIASAAQSGVAGFAAALLGALYAYQGWQSLALMAGEVRAPERTLPRALIASVLVVGVLYVAANASYLRVLTPEALARIAPSTSVGVTVVGLIFGTPGRIVAAALLAGSAAATLHVGLLSGARVTYAFARDAFGIRTLARLTPQGVPVNAVLLGGAFSCVLILAGTFDTLSNYLVFNSWVFFVATGAALFVLRRREPQLVRPYRCFGYPFVPLAYVLVGGWLLVQTALTDPAGSSIGIAIVLASVPVYVWHARAALGRS